MLGYELDKISIKHFIHLSANGFAFHISDVHLWKVFQICTSDDEDDE